MASPRAHLASFGLEEAKVSLTPSNNRQSLGDPLDGQQPPALGDVASFPSVAISRRGTLKPYPVRLDEQTTTRLEALKSKFGIFPSRFVRDAIVNALDNLDRSSK